MRRIISVVLALGLALSLSLVMAVPALAYTEAWVDDDFDGSTPGFGTTRFDSIQTAIDYIFTLPDTGTVYVNEGTYNENVSVRNGVNVIGAGPGSCSIIAPGGIAVNANSVGPGTTFSGFYVTGGNTGYGGGMYIAGSWLTVSDCVFDNNQVTNRGGGIYCTSNSDARIIDCTITFNTAGQGGGGIACRDNSDPTIANCVILVALAILL